MMKFKIGDRVKTKFYTKGGKETEYKEGTIVNIDKETRSYDVRFEDTMMWVHEAGLEAVEEDTKETTADDPEEREEDKPSIEIKIRDTIDRYLKELEAEAEDEEDKEVALELTKAWTMQVGSPATMDEVIDRYFHTIKRLKEERNK